MAKMFSNDNINSWVVVETEANTIIAAYYICYKADYIQLDVKAKT